MEHVEEMNIRIGNFTGGATSNLNEVCNFNPNPQIEASLFVFDRESPSNDNVANAQPLDLSAVPLLRLPARSPMMLSSWTEWIFTKSPIPIPRDSGCW